MADSEGTIRIRSRSPISIDARLIGETQGSLDAYKPSLDEMSSVVQLLAILYAGRKISYSLSHVL